MAATFNPTLEAPIDRIRQRIGDTVTARAQVEDETIQAYLGTGLSELAVARQLCYDLAAKWTSAGTVTLDDQQQRADTIAKKYLDLAAQISRQLAAPPQGVNGSAIIVGGLDDTRGPITEAPNGRDWPWLVSN